MATPCSAPERVDCRQSCLIVTNYGLCRATSSYLSCMHFEFASVSACSTVLCREAIMSIFKLLSWQRRALCLCDSIASIMTDCH